MTGWVFGGIVPSLAWMMMEFGFNLT